MKFSISTSWDGRPIDHVPAKINLTKNPENASVIVTVKAPFFNDPPAPKGEPNQPFPKLWDYEVVEIFFLGAEDKYLEIELGPHGHHLLLILNGAKNLVKDLLPIKYSAAINGKTWIGIAEIPFEYFPPRVSKMNAYAIHGSDPSRQYQSLYPVETGKFNYPDFHRLEYFKSIDFSTLLPKNNTTELSLFWKEALDNIKQNHNFYEGLTELKWRKQNHYPIINVLKWPRIADEIYEEI